MVPDTGSVKTAARVLRCLLFNRHSLPERLHYSQACLGELMACYAEAVLAEVDDVEGEIAGLGDVEARSLSDWPHGGGEGVLERSPE